MEIVDFEGKTRILGKEQGYRPLPIKDIIAHVNIGNGEIVKVPAMMSVWKPTEEELMILMHNGYISLTVLGNSHPPVEVTVLRDA